MEGNMTDKKMNDIVMKWTGRDLAWNEAEMVWIASQDGGELIQYFTNLVKKMKVAEVTASATKKED
jgi:hypothetical protein